MKRLPLLLPLAVPFMVPARPQSPARAFPAVRVGLEDSIHLPDGSVPRDNTEVVRAAIRIAAICGLSPATVEDARARFRI